MNYKYYGLVLPHEEAILFKELGFLLDTLPPSQRFLHFDDNMAASLYHIVSVGRPRSLEFRA